MIGIFSKGIIKTVPHLEIFLQDKVVYNPKRPDGLKAVAGWGYKPTARKAIKKAKEWGLPYLALEDGFIRSIGLGFEEPPLSLIVDPVGIYYDATKPSLLENLLNSDDWKNDKVLEEGDKALKLVLKHKISKYNNGRPVPDGYFKQTDRERVLLIDQTYGDMSVELGLANEETFKNMLNYVLKKHTDAEIYVKVHPDVLSGKKKGYLARMKLPRNIKPIKENFNALSLLEKFDIIYTVSSQMGFEGLILGKEVICFGIPFYSGWGLTKDTIKCDRRKKKLNLLEIFTACYLLYPKYLDPLNMRLGNIFDVVEFICSRREACV